jgi:hypothetical protein
VVNVGDQKHFPYKIAIFEMLLQYGLTLIYILQPMLYKKVSIYLFLVELTFCCIFLWPLLLHKINYQHLLPRLPVVSFFLGFCLIGRLIPYH